MKPDFSETEQRSAHIISDLLARGDTVHGVEKLRALKDELYAAIPANQRISRGITWVLQRITQLLVAECDHTQQIRTIAELLYANIPLDDMLVFFTQVADSENWVVCEFAAAAFHKLIKPCRAAVLPWMKAAAQSDRPRLRRLVSESLRPVTENQWLQKEPETSLEILRLLFREAHPYPRTSVGNNLSDLARRNPDLILGIVKELVESEDENSYWIAYRACRNMVKKDPEKIMNLLGIDEYHYKDRNFFREK
jgi:3-methyladenine DNA glycosylase AlkC